MQNKLPLSYRGGMMVAAFIIFAVSCAAAALAWPSSQGVRRVALKHPKASATFIAKPTPARLARGRYLVESVANCFDCHSEHEYVNGQWLIKPGMKGAGRIFSSSFTHFPPHSEIVAPNITPDRATGIGSWTDTQIEEAIRHGVAKGGRPLFNLMPYSQLRALSDEDAKSIIVYLRSIPAVHHVLPTTRLPFPVHVNMDPAMTPPLAKNASAQVRRGWYLVRIAHCADCHTPLSPHGVRSPALMFAGGMQFRGPFGVAVSLNITPSPAGIGSMTEAMFARTLRTGRIDGTGRKLSPVMPYGGFKHLKDADIRAIYAYLRTVPPVPHE